MFVYGANSDSGYDITDSLRFRSSASAYLSRTPASSGNRKTFTVSMWVKRGTLGVEQKLITAHGGNDNNGYFELKFNSSDQLYFGVYTTGSTSAAVFRDSSAWYHVVLKIDTTQASSANRVKVYVNNTDHTIDVGSTLAQNTDLAWNRNVAHSIGRDTRDTNKYIDGYITEVHNVDGTALAPSDFGEYDDNGTWIPKKYTGSYGTNGFYLNFSNSSSVAALGTDSSGNSNTWTVNNVSLTAGVTYDLMSDVPTLTDEDTSNFATLNPNNAGTNSDVTFGNLKIANSSSHSTIYPTNMPTTGKYYFECKMAVHAAAGGLGFRTDTNKAESAYAEEANKYFLYLNNSSAYIVSETSNVNIGSNLNSGTATFQVAIDFDASEYYFGVNNTWYAADAGTDGNPATGANPTYNLTDGTKMFPFLHTGGLTWTVNFGQQPFNYTPPSGFKKINTFNLPDSTIEDGSEHFDILTWSGNGAVDRAITGLEFQPDFTWIKSRSNAVNHWLMNSVNGARKGISSNNTGAEQAFDQANFDFESFDSNGFSVSPPYYAHVNTSGHTFVGWNWKGNGTGSSNTDGSITSTVSANTTAGFSVVTYTGNGGTGTVGHGLGIEPKMVIIKNRSQADGWYVWHTSNSAGVFGYLFLNDADQLRSSTPQFGSTVPSSSVISLTRNTYDWANASGENYVAYCFAEVEGYSKFGSYTGNGSADGPFIYTGFRPAFVIIKSATEARNWLQYDTAINTYNQSNTQLFPNLSNAEYTSGTYAGLDILSNGFKLRNNDTSGNNSGQTMIYMAFAENPFKNSNAR